MAALLAPAATFFLLAYILPLAHVIGLSAYQTDFVSIKFVGLANYVRAFTDMDFLKTFVTSLVYVAMVVPPSVYLSYRLAVSLQGLGRRERTVMQMIAYLPTLTSGIILALVWQWVFGRGGLIALGMGGLGLEPVAWFAGGWTARAVVAFSVAFGSIGGNCLWLSAVLLSVPRELYDAATVDGANRRQLLKHITRPLLASTLVLLALLQAIGAFQYWESVYALTGGGPFKMTATPVFDIYTTAFVYAKHGMAAAKSVMLVVFIAALLGVKKLSERQA